MNQGRKTPGFDASRIVVIGNAIKQRREGLHIGWKAALGAVPMVGCSNSCSEREEFLEGS